MSLTFETRKSINVLLFILKSLGGTSDIYRLFSLMYLSELSHLAKYGSLITGDNYVAMKNGAVPLNMYSIYQQLRGSGYVKGFINDLKEYIAIGENGTITAITDYDEDHISLSEAACLFATIRGHKAETSEQLQQRTMDTAWQKADITNDISVHDMAVAAGASRQLLAYLLRSLVNETTLLNESNSTGH